MKKKVSIYSNYKNIVTYFVEKTDVWLEEVEDTKGQSESVYRRRRDNTMAKRKSTKGQTTLKNV